LQKESDAAQEHNLHGAALNEEPATETSANSTTVQQMQTTGAQQTQKDAEGAQNVAVGGGDWCMLMGGLMARMEAADATPATPRGSPGIFLQLHVSCRDTSAVIIT
jgi:5,10-methylene-tetrahydrofolate dehydrogenase/methenyl tetrahydrofolate cyclohydrolase